MRLQIDLPDELAARLGASPAQAGERARQAVVCDLLRSKDISASYAAALLGVPLHELLDELARQGIPIIDYDPAELASELDGAR